MCGICGVVRPRRGDAVPAGLVQAMAGTLVHRGPDDHGEFAGPGVGLGSRRLSIIDLATGRMPLSNEDGTVWIVQNGEIYNFEDLRADLEARGHAFRTRSDTEAIVHGYEEEGEAFVRRMRGMFAVAIWDGRPGRERLVLLRDRVGIKPVYYAQVDDGTLVFGSEIKALLAHPGVKREIEPRALDLYLTVEYVPAPWTIFKGVRKLPAGHTLVYEGGRVRVEKYWDVEPGETGAGGSDGAGAFADATDPAFSRGDRAGSFADATDRLHEILRESVRLRLISDVPLGAFLSGGIDSSTIVGLMRELGASPLRTFSIGFTDSSYNELGYARAVAERFRTEHEELVCEPKALELTEKLVRHLDEPLADFSIFPTYLVSKMARERVTVILSGDGGDELFGGYEHYQAQRVARWPLAALAAKAAGPVLRRMPPSEKKKGPWNMARRFAEGFDGRPARLRHLRWMTFQSRRGKSLLYGPALREALGGIPEVADVEPFRSVFERMRGFDAVNAELYLDLKTYLPDDIMVKVDRMSMAPSLEAREPLLDHKLVEFAFTLPGAWKVRGMKTKWVFKKAMERMLPAETVWRKKEGFSSPIKHWLRTDLRELMLERLAPRRLEETGLFEPAAVRSMIDAHLAGRENFSHQLWALFVFETWRASYMRSG